MKDAKGHGSNSRGGLTNAAQEKVQIAKAVDASHFPQRSPSDIAAAQALGGHPKSSVPNVHPAMSAQYFPNLSPALRAAARARNTNI